MYTLLLPSQKKQARGYMYSRFLLIGIKMCTLLGVVLGVVLVPSYILVQSEYAYISSCIGAYGQQPVGADGGEVFSDPVLKEGEYVREIVFKHANIVLPTEVFASVLSVTEAHVVLRSFAYDGKTGKVSIDGVAQSKEALVALVEALRVDTNFSEVPRITDVLQQDSTAFRLQFLYVDQEK